jgi:glycosyltransferase involved in cell wall biosynthesis
MSESTFEDERRGNYRELLKRRLVRLFSSALVGGKPQAYYVSLLGMEKDRIISGYDVVDNDHFLHRTVSSRLASEKIRHELHLPEHFFLASNRFVPKKNLFRLINAYARYRANAGSTAWKLVLLGDGQLNADIIEIINSFGLAGDIMLPGFRQYDELPKYYGLADAFVHASTSEQWGLVVNEAMASGLPVIVSKHCGCAPDLVQEGVNGYTFDPYKVDQLAALMTKISSPDCDRNAMGQASRSIISHWTPETFAENLLKAAQAAIEAPRPRASILDKLLLRAMINR